MAYPNFIAFPMTPDRVAHYSQGDNAIFAQLFDTETSRMVLEVWPGQYVPRLRSLSSTDVVEGLKSSLPRTATAQQEATIEISCGFSVVGEVINELRADAIANSSYKITVHDGCMVGWNDRMQGYTVRQWWLKQPVLPKASQGRLTVGQSIDERFYAGYTLDFTRFGK